MTDLDRRTFLRRLGFGTIAAAAAANAVLDVERLLWTREKSIFVLAPRHGSLTLGETHLRVGDVITIADHWVVNPDLRMVAIRGTYHSFTIRACV